jgi:CspA family cold shock protein
MSSVSHLSESPARASGAILGKVKWFDPAKGYGFIKSDATDQDVFVHYSVIRGDGFRSLHDGESVLFQLVNGAKGPKAENVEKLDPSN